MNKSILLTVVLSILTCCYAETLEVDKTTNPWSYRVIGEPTKISPLAIADGFNSSTNYAVGDVVMFYGSRYVCTNAVTAGHGFKSTDWKKENVQNALESGGGGGKTDYNTVSNIANAVVSPVSNVVFNSETYFSLDNDNLSLVSETNLVWQSAYELTNATKNATSVVIYSGQTALLEMDGTTGTNLAVTLKFPVGAQVCGDAILRLNCVSNTVVDTLTLTGIQSFVIEGSKDWPVLEAGKHLVSFTKTAATNRSSSVRYHSAKSQKERVLLLT